MQKVKSFELGRSMIEMLGVLAIIGVLSVGGIAGYSKAMEKFKINKTIEQYNYLIFGMLDNIKDTQKITETTGLTNIAEAAGLIPATWTIVAGTNNNIVQDELGNNIQMFAQTGTPLSIDFRLENFNKKSFTHRLCTELFQNTLIPLNEAIRTIYIYNGQTDDSIYRGKSTCVANLSGKRKCLVSATLSDIKKSCDFCADNKNCAIAVKFE